MKIPSIRSLLQSKPTDCLATHWVTLDKLLDIAQEAKHLVSVLKLHGVGFVGIQLEEMIEDLETT